jgi:nucleotide-binding universal stress UspA family protein
MGDALSARRQGLNIMATASSPFSIVVGLDFLDAGGYAFEQAARVARTIAGSQVHLVHVFEGEVDDARRKQLIGQLRLYANEKAISLGGLPGVRVGVHLRVGDPAREILQLASDLSATMIVIGAHKKSDPGSWLLGTVAQRLLQWSSCPVLVAGPKPPPLHHEPAIEPPCADCSRTRVDSKGTTWWCERHSHHAARAHVFSYQRELPLETHDSAVVPTGIDF